MTDEATNGKTRPVEEAEPVQRRILGDMVTPDHVRREDFLTHRVLQAAIDAGEVANCGQAMLAAGAMDILEGRNLAALYSLLPPGDAEALGAIHQFGGPAVQPLVERTLLRRSGMDRVLKMLLDVLRSSGGAPQKADLLGRFLGRDDD